MASDKSKAVLRFTALVIIGAVVAGIAPFVAIGGLGGIESEAFIEKVQIFWGLLTIGILGFGALYFRSVFKKDKKKFGFAFIHDPDEGILTKVAGFRWARNGFKIFMVSIIFFSLVGLLGVISNTFFWQPPTIGQQFTTGGQLIGETEPASFAESTLDLFVLFLILSFVKWIQFKNKFGKDFFNGIAFTLVPILMGFWRVAYHFTRYGGSELNLFAVFLPGWLQSYFVLLFGTVIIYYVWHFTNNFFFGMNTLFSDEVTVVATLATLFFLGVIFFIVWIRLKNGKPSKFGFALPGGG